MADKGQRTKAGLTVVSNHESLDWNLRGRVQSINRIRVGGGSWHKLSCQRLFGALANQWDDICDELWKPGQVNPLFAHHE